jgi:hypothetical protein
MLREGLKMVGFSAKVSRAGKAQYMKKCVCWKKKLEKAAECLTLLSM